MSLLKSTRMFYMIYRTRKYTIQLYKYIFTVGPNSPILPLLRDTSWLITGWAVIDFSRESPYSVYLEHCIFTLYNSLFAVSSNSCSSHTTNYCCTNDMLATWVFKACLIVQNISVHSLYLSQKMMRLLKLT